MKQELAFHAFHHGWIIEISRALNRGLPPGEYYALPEWIVEDAKAKAVVIRHTSNRRVIAMIEIVSPRNKNARNALRSFVSKATDMLRAGVHLLILDILPPGERDILHFIAGSEANAP